MKKKATVVWLLAPVVATLLPVLVHAQSAFFQAVTNLNPVAYWPLQETVQPPAADVEQNLGSLGAVANAYYSSTNVVKGVPGINSGDSDPAVNLQSGLAGGFLAVPLTDSRVILPAGAFTVEAWVYPTNSSASTIVAQTGPAGSGGLNGGANSAGWSLNLGYVPSLNAAIPALASFHIYNGVGPAGGAEASCAVPNFSINNWYHVVGVFDGVNATVYVNAVTNAIIPIIPMTGTQAQDTWDELTIGCGRGLNNNRFGGSMDEVAIYTYALTAAQVTTHYNTGIGGAGGYQAAILADNPYMYWRMDAPAYTAPSFAAYPAALNYGTGANINGLYLSGTTPGVAGPSLSGMGSSSLACAVNGLGTDSTNAIPIFTNGVAYSTNTAAETGVIITNFLSSMNLVTNSMTFMCWFKQNPSDNRRNVLIGHGDSSWRTSMSGGGVTANTGKGGDLGTSLQYNDGNWHFAAIVYSNTFVHVNITGWAATNYIYVDGTLIASAVVTNASGSGSFTNVAIGVAPDHVRTGNGNTYDNQVLAGSIAHVAFFTNALSAVQIASLYLAAGGTPLPVITGQPIAGRTNSPGTGNNGSGPGSYIFFGVNTIGATTYQWYFNSSSNYSGATALVTGSKYLLATTSQMTVTNLADSDSGYYFVVVGNGYGFVTSSLASFQVENESYLPSQVPAGGTLQLYQNQNFALSVTDGGEGPLTYQWYTNGVADSSAGTGSSYALTAVQPAMSGFTYQCIVGNSFNSATSAPVTLAVLSLPAALTNSLYSSNLLALSPSGYWPLHEVAPPAPGDFETNLGSLGSLANGYYADWAQGGSNIIHQVAGALANDSDTAVLFNNSPDVASPGYLLIPRTSPATTLTPPFTLEAWVKPLNTGFGDIISQGPFGANSGAGSIRSGVRMGWGSGTASSGLSSDFIFFIGPGVNSNPSYPSTPGANLAINQWYHIALVTADGTNWTFYVNGNVHYTFVLPMAIDTGDPLLVGQGLWQNGGPQRAFPGAIDEVAVYTSALQASDISTHYSDGTSGSPGQYKSDVLSLNPIIYLRMDGPANTPPVNTWPVAANYGTVAVNGVYSPGSLPGAVAGVNLGGIPAGKNAMPGNGMSSYVDAGGNAAFNPVGSTAFSFGAWFRGNPGDPRSFQSIMGHSDSSFRAALNSTGKLQAHGGTNDVTSGAVYNDGYWHQFFLTYTGTNTTYNSTNTGIYGISTLYVDGAAVGQSVGGANAGTSTLDLMIGDDPQYTNNPVGPGRSLAGQVCEAVFWNGLTLSANQVTNLFNASELVPYITKQPVSANANANSAFTNSVSAFGSGTLSYQWYRNNQPLPIGGQTNLTLGATNASLSIDPVTSADASANYYVVISNAGGSITSSIVALNVFTQPIFTSEPVLAAYTNNLLLFANATPTFRVATIGAQPVYYQWFTNGVPATTASVSLANFTMSPLQQNAVTNFYCVATNFVGMTTNTPVGITVLAAPTAPYPQAVMLDSPAGYWRLNEANVDNFNDGYLANDYWSGNNGVYSNTVLGLTGYSATEPSVTSAEFGADSFSDNDAYGINGVNFGGPGTNSFSIEAWVNGDTLQKDAGIVSKGYGGSEQFDLDTGADGGTPNHAFRFLVRDNSGAVHSVNSTIAPFTGGGWSHLVGVCDESNGVVTFYINGAPVGSTSITPGSGILASSRAMIIGSRPSSISSSNDLQLIGDVNDVAVYNYALSPGQVANHYTSVGVPPNFTQLPATNLSVNGFSTLTLLAGAVGTPPLTNYWTDLGAGTNFPSGTTNGALINASLIVSNVPISWNGDSLQLTVANAYGSTNFTVSLTVFTNAPLITLNLPPLVNVATGKAYTYSISVVGPQPYSYQWYNGAAAIPGATNSSYPLVAGAPGSTTYSVVVTNVFGATTSTVSIFTSETPPSGYSFATSVLGLNPVGYWPLQETNAPAAAAMETNYGTLGPLGNAYYSGTNASTVNLAQPGALTGDPDTAAGFGIGQISYALVPRISPALTIQAPFSLEAWVNTSNTTYGIIIGEGGGTGLNGATSFGGFQLGFGASEAQMQYYTGGNNTFNQFNSPASYGAGTWYHVVATYDGVNSTTYVDGVVVATGTTANTPDTWSPLCIGNGKWDFGVNGGIRQLAATIDEVAVYTNILSAGRVLDHYNAGTAPATYGAYNTNVLADQPLLYYRMDCPGYTNTPAALCPMAVNFGSAPVNGAYLSGTMPGIAAGPTNSVFGTNSVAVPINGLISCVDAGNDPSFNRTGTQPLTAMTWFRTYPSDGRLETIMSHGATNWTMNLDGTTGHVIWSLFNAGQITSSAILNDGNWHFVAGVYDGANISLYVDGALDSSAVASAGLTGEPNLDVYLGGNADFTQVGNNERFFAGALAQAALFTNALSSAQIQMFYQGSVNPAIAIGPSAGNLIINYTGRLLSSPVVNGTYNPVAGAPFNATPGNFVTSPTNAQLFYRAGSQ